MRLTTAFNYPFRSLASSAAILYRGSSSSAVLRCDSLDSMFGSVCWQSDRMTLSQRYYRVLGLFCGPSLISLLSLSRWVMMTLLSAFKFLTCSFTSAFSLLQWLNYQFYSASFLLNFPQRSSTFTVSTFTRSSPSFAFLYHSWAVFSYLLNLVTSLSSTATFRSDSDSKIAFFYQRVSLSLFKFFMKRITSSFWTEESLIGVLMLESAVDALPRVKLPMIFPSERLRLALQTEISWSISLSLRRLRSVIANFYFDYMPSKPTIPVLYTLALDRVKPSCPVVLAVRRVEDSHLGVSFVFGHAFVALGSFEGALLTIVVHDVVHEQRGHLGVRLQVELVTVLRLFVSPQGQNLIGMLCPEPPLQGLKILQGQVVVLVAVHQLDERGDQNSKDVFSVELILLLVCHFIEQDVESRVVKQGG